jgi:hypothetical protein
MLPFGPEYSGFLSVVEKCEDLNIQDHSFACGSI